MGDVEFPHIEKYNMGTTSILALFTTSHSIEITEIVPAQDQTSLRHYPVFVYCDGFLVQIICSIIIQRLNLNTPADYCGKYAFSSKIQLEDLLKTCQFLQR